MLQGWRAHAVGTESGSGSKGGQVEMLKRSCAERAQILASWKIGIRNVEESQG
jgi:hypothetical protein